MVRKSIKSGRDFKGIWIPKEIWLNPDISPIEKLLVCEIDSLDNDEETGCFASNEYFGNFFRMSEGAIANMVSSLKKRDIIFQVFFDGRNRGLRLHKNVKAGFTIEGISVHKNVKAGFTKRGKQVSRKNEHNNTENNTLNNTESERAAPAEIQNPSTSKAEISKRDVAPPESPEQITPWNEGLLAVEFLKHIAGETPETAAKHAKEICQKIEIGPLANATDEEVNDMVDRSRREAGELCLKISQSTAPLRYDQYPRPTNAKELREAMSAYFKDNPHEWSDGVLEEGKAKNWPKEKVMDTVTMFCAHQESEGNFKRTYGQYKGMMVKWFLNQSRFDIPVQPNGHSVNREQSVLPSNIRRYK